MKLQLFALQLDQFSKKSFKPWNKAWNYLQIKSNASVKLVPRIDVIMLQEMMFSFTESLFEVAIKLHYLFYKKRIQSHL